LVSFCDIHHCIALTPNCYSAVRPIALLCFTEQCSADSATYNKRHEQHTAELKYECLNLQNGKCHNKVEYLKVCGFKAQPCQTAEVSLKDERMCTAAHEHACSVLHWFLFHSYHNIVWRRLFLHKHNMYRNIKLCCCYHSFIHSFN